MASKMSAERTYMNKSQVHSPVGNSLEFKKAPFSPTGDMRYSSMNTGNTNNNTFEDSLMMPSTDVPIKETDLRKVAANVPASSRLRNTGAHLQFAPHILE